MEKGQITSKYAITYINPFDGEQWTFTSCELFESTEAALLVFPFKFCIIQSIFKVYLK